MALVKILKMIAFFCSNASEDIDHLFKNCDLTKQIWNTISDYCPNLKDYNVDFIDWIEFI